MAQSNSSTSRANEPHHVLVHATMEHRCSACGFPIQRGEYFFHYDTGTTACMSCALGPESSGPSLPAVAGVAEVAA